MKSILMFLVCQMVGAARIDCPCLSRDKAMAALFTYISPSSNNLLYDGHTFPLDYGAGTCQAWDNNVSPYCSDDISPPEWCSAQWCFVDAEECATKVFTYTLFDRSPLVYSYAYRPVHAAKSVPVAGMQLDLSLHILQRVAVGCLLSDSCNLDSVLQVLDVDYGLQLCEPIVVFIVIQYIL